MKSKVIYRVKTSENDHHIYYDEYHFWGFIGHRKTFTNRLLSSIVPFSNGRAAWHILGFRFTKTPMQVSKCHQEINGWHTKDRRLVERLRNL